MFNVFLPTKKHLCWVPNANPTSNGWTHKNGPVCRKTPRGSDVWVATKKPSTKKQQQLPAHSKGCQLNPKGWWSKTPCNICNGTIWHPFVDGAGKKAGCNGHNTEVVQTLEVDVSVGRWDGFRTRGTVKRDLKNVVDVLFWDEFWSHIKWRILFFCVALYGLVKKKSTWFMRDLWNL